MSSTTPPHTPSPPGATSGSSWLRQIPWTRILRLCGWLYVFMISIKLMGAGFKTLGTGFDLDRLLQDASSNPIEGLCIGILVTALVQSSSFTTSMLVTLVAAGTIPLVNAVPIIMGANIGTTITNNFVATAHVARRNEFRLAFSGGTVHDIFNMLTVCILLPVESLLHPLQRLSELIGPQITRIWGADSGGKMGKGPLDAVLNPVLTLVKDTLESSFGEDKTTWIGVSLLILAIICLFLALSRMVVVLKQFFMSGAEKVLDDVIFKRWWTALLFGTIVTTLIQSSSMTVSLIVPMVASGILTLEKAFPVALGANIGTTITAFMAAVIAGSPSGVALALCHFFFNIIGTAIFLPLRQIPIGLARRLGDVVFKRRWLAFVYVFIMFFLIPSLIVFIIEL